MSTILDALRERDGGGTPVSWREERAWVRRWWPAAVLVVSTMLAATLVLRRSISPARQPVAGAAPSVRVEPSVPPPPRPAVPDGDEQPRAHVEKRWTPAGPPPLQPAPPPAAAPMPAATPTPPGPATAQLPSEPPAAAPLAPAGSSLALQSIWYSDAVEQRTVMLSIDGRAPVRLRQGDVMGGVEVQLILPEAVYVRRGGDVFALGDVR